MQFRPFLLLPIILGFASLCCGRAEAAEGWDFHVLAPLCVEYSCPSGADPGPLTIDSTGRLFGTLQTGGIHGSGAVFEMTKKPGNNKWIFHTIYHFCARLSCRDGSGPLLAGLVVDSAGSVYGTTESGGSRHGGVFFKLTPNRNGKNWNLTVLHNFCSRNSACTDGGSPQGRLTYDGQAQNLPYDGVSPLYGTAAGFASHGHGAVFSLQPKAGDEEWHETTLYSFCPKKSGPDCTDGTNPYDLSMDAVGNLIGVAGGGVPVGQFGHGGVLFKLSPVVGQRHWAETVIHSFCSQTNCADGVEPAGAPLIDQDGNLIGFTLFGGNTQCGGEGCGTIYSVTPDGTLSVLYDFCSRAQCTDGLIPLGTPTIDAGGNLFGATEQGGRGRNDRGNTGGGTVFEFSGSTLSTLHAFCLKTNCPNGEYPSSGGVVMDGSGNLFGTTYEGGPNQSGEVFDLLHP